MVATFSLNRFIFPVMGFEVTDEDHTVALKWVRVC